MGTATQNCIDSDLAIFDFSKSAAPLAGDANGFFAFFDNGSFIN
jgi:hypothetical protein